MDVTTKAYRIKLGSIGYAWAIVIATADALGWVVVNSGIFTSVVGFSSGLLIAGLIDRRWGSGSVSSNERSEEYDISK